MSAFSNTLYNPTSFPVSYNYEKGINLRIEPFGSIDLSMEMVKDFTKDVPGAEAISEITDFLGIFLNDPKRSYDDQALEAIRRCLKSRKIRYDEGVNRLRDNLAQSRGSYTNDDLREHILRNGFDKLEREIESLRKQEAAFDKVVERTTPIETGTQLDPERTVFAVEPPKEFPSKAALEFFLSENPEIAEKHNKWVEALNENNS